MSADGLAGMHEVEEDDDEDDDEDDMVEVS